MARITNIVNKEVNFPKIKSWVDFGTGNGSVVKGLKWNSEAKIKLAIEKYKILNDNSWKLYDSLDLVLTEYDNLDLFTSFDCIEHLTKEDGIKLIDKVNTYFKYSLFFTPKGFLKQDEETHPELLKQNPWQKHISGWEPEDFESFGYEVKVFKNYHLPKGHNKYFDAILAYRKK